MSVERLANQVSPGSHPVICAATASMAAGALEQLVVKVALHSADDASRSGLRWTSHQRGHMLPVFSLVAPCTRRALLGSSGPSVQRGTFTTGC